MQSIISVPYQHCLLSALPAVALPCWRAEHIACKVVRCVDGAVYDRVVADLQHKNVFEVRADLPGVDKDTISVKVNLLDAQKSVPWRCPVCETT